MEIGFEINMLRYNKYLYGPYQKCFTGHGNQDKIWYHLLTALIVAIIIFCPARLNAQRADETFPADRIGVGLHSIPGYAMSWVYYSDEMSSRLFNGLISQPSGLFFHYRRHIHPRFDYRGVLTISSLAPWAFGKGVNCYYGAGSGWVFKNKGRVLLGLNLDLTHRFTSQKIVSNGLKVRYANHFLGLGPSINLDYDLSPNFQLSTDFAAMWEKHFIRSANVYQNEPFPIEAWPSYIRGFSLTLTYKLRK